MLQLRIGEREGRLIELDEALEAVETLIRTHAQGLSAQCTRDLPTRCAIDAAVNQMLHKIADEAELDGGIRGPTAAKREEARDDD